MTTTDAPANDNKRRKKKRSTKKKRSRKARASPPEGAARGASPRPGCRYAVAGCEGERIIRWEEAAPKARALVKLGEMTLCDRHMNQLAEAGG